MLKSQALARALGSDSVLCYQFDDGTVSATGAEREDLQAFIGALLLEIDALKRRHWWEFWRG